MPAQAQEKDLSRLPKWAQREIERLRKDLAHAHAKLTAGPEDSDTFADPYGQPRPLGVGTRIQYVIDSDSYAGSMHAQIHEDSRGRYLEIYVDGMLCVEPQSSNVVRVRSEER